MHDRRSCNQRHHVYAIAVMLIITTIAQHLPGIAQELSPWLALAANLFWLRMDIAD